MKRRDFLTLAGAAATAPAWPFAGLAQVTAKVPRVALIAASVPTSQIAKNGDAAWAAFLNELEAHDFVEGRGIIFERYTGAGQGAAAYADLARTVVAGRPDAIVIAGTQSAALAAGAATQTIPIIVEVGDLSVGGIVTNFAHPGGNVTGANGNATGDAEAKVLSLLVETVPKARRIAYLNTGTDGHFASGGGIERIWQVASSAAPSIGVTLVPVIVDDPGLERDYREAVDRIASEQFDAIQVGSGPTNLAQQLLLAKLTVDRRVPAIAPWADFARGSGLVAYGASLTDAFRRLAISVVLVLRGANPGDIPVTQPTVFDMVINLKTAKAIGVTIPVSLLAQATEVIQ